MDRYIVISRDKNIVKARLMVFNKGIDSVEALLTHEISNPTFIQFIQELVDKKHITYILFDIGDTELMRSLKDLFYLVGLEKAHIKNVDELDTVVIDIREKDNKYKVDEILFG